VTIEARFLVDRGDFTLDVDLNVPDRGVTSVFGPSGCGKTTLLRAIAGLDHHPGGFVRIGDRTWQQGNSFTPPHQRSVGYVFQEPSLFDHLDVAGNLQYGLKRAPEAERRVSVDEAIELLEIGHLLGRKPDRLSGGEKQRVAIARALAISPELLLMDEPLASLDQERKNEILPYLESLHRNFDTPVVYVSHSADEVARLADHLILLQAGNVAASGGIDEMLTRLDLPLAHRDRAEALIQATVAAHDEDYDLTYLDSPGGRFTVGGRALPIGRRVRLRIAARDVSLTLESQSGTSILNIFPAVVDELTPEGNAQVTVRLRVGGLPVLARVTRKSATVLGLQPGTDVYAQVKSVALVA
jgi:molybdate transport system ATP-binding protein